MVKRNNMDTIMRFFRRKLKNNQSVFEVCPKCGGELVIMKKNKTIYSSCRKERLYISI